MIWFVLPAGNAHAANAISAKVWIDADADGTVDHIKLTWDANITQCTYEAGDWTVNNASPLTIAITGINTSDPEGNGDGACDGNDAVIYVSVTADAGETSSGAAPVISYTNQGTANSLQDSGVITNKPSISCLDGAPPQIITAKYSDLDADGMIDQFTIDFSEVLVAASVLAADNLTLTNVGDFTSAAFGSSTTDLITGVVGNANVTLGTEASVKDTFEGSSNIAITTVDGNAAFTLEDTNGNINTTPKLETQITFEDNAKPIITSVTPDVGSVAQSRTDAFVWNFSEQIDSSGGWVSGAEFLPIQSISGFGAAVWSNSDTTVTITHAPLLCVTNYVIDTIPMEIDAVNGSVGYTQLQPGFGMDFTTMSCSTDSDSDSSTAVEVTYDIEVLTPNGGETLTEGEEYEVTWEADPEGEYYIDLYYLDGEDYVEIATQEANDGSYTWEVPEGVEDSMIKVIWNDLADELDSDTSDSVFNATEDATDTDDDADTTDDEDTTEDADEEAAEAPSGTGISPVTGEEEEITAVEAGDFITSPSFSTVYYVTEDFERRAFISSAVFFTYADSYDEIKDVTDATLTALTLGDNMLPNPGVVLVKVQSDAKTYAVTSDSQLGWIESEDDAIEIYGEDWADYVIDIESVFFGQFTIGDDVDDPEDVELIEMKTRESLQ